MIDRISITVVLAAVIAISAIIGIDRETRAADVSPNTSTAPAQPVVAPAKPLDVTPAATPEPAAVANAAASGSTPAEQPISESNTPPPNYEVVVARVGDEKITVHQLMKYMTQDTQMVLKSRTAEGRAEVLREMIIDRLIEAGMRREELLPKDHAPSRKDYLQAYQQLAARNFPAPKETPSEESLYKYYEQHSEYFGIPTMLRIGQIQFRVPADADEKTKAEIKTKAEGALKRLRAGESFAVLAESLTDNPQGKVAKGDLGFLQPDSNEWLQKAVAGLVVGQVSEVLESPVGYEILLVQDKRDAMLAPYANVRSNIIGRLQQEIQAKAREEYAWKLAKDVGVSVEKPELKSAIPESVASGIKAPEVKTPEAKTPEAKTPVTKP